MRVDHQMEGAYELSVTLSLRTRDPLLGGPPPIDVERVPGYERGRIGAEVEGRSADLLDVAPAAERDATGEQLRHYRVLQGRDVQRRGEGGGGDRVDGSAVGRPLERQGLSEAEQARFRGRVGAAARHRGERHDGGEGHRPSPVPLDEVRTDSAAAVE